MKVIFLDFDGVMNSYHSELIDPECVGVLSAIIEETGELPPQQVVMIT